MYKLLCYIINISYIAIYKTENINFIGWTKVKNRINYLINSKIIKWVSTNSYNSPYNLGDQFVLDSIIELIFIHYRQRVTVYKFVQKIPWFRRKLFVQICLFLIFFVLLGKLFRELMSNIYYFKKIPYTGKKINISIKFPQHSFNLARNYNSDKFYSFGEYLTLNHPNEQIISIDEYVRQSKKNELTSQSKKLLNLIRFKPTKVKNLIRSFFRIFNVIFQLFREKKLNGAIFLKLIYFRKYFYKYNFNNMLSDLGLSNSNIKNIFILPFADVGLLKYDHEYHKKFIAYSYSQNSLIMPSPKLEDIDTNLRIFQYMQLYPLILTENSYGFTSIYNSVAKIKKKLNKGFSLSLQIPSVTQSENPVTLGYENINFPRSIENQLLKRPIVAIFDNPPITHDVAISISTTGEKTCGYKFIENFILDTVEISILNGFSIIMKPKYSLSNYNDSYSNFLKSIKKKYKNKIIIAEPYLRIGEIVKHSFCSIHIPYTSTKMIFENSNISSVFYVPEKYRLGFENNNATCIVYGKKGLQLYMKQLKYNKFHN